MNITALITEAKSKGINDPRMIASWIYNERKGKKYVTFKGMRTLVEEAL